MDDKRLNDSGARVGAAPAKGTHSELQARHEGNGDQQALRGGFR